MPRQYLAEEDFLLSRSRERGRQKRRRGSSCGTLLPQAPPLHQADWLDDLPDCGWDDDDFDDLFDCQFQDSEDAWSQAFCLRQDTPQARLRRRIRRSGLRWLHGPSSLGPSLGFNLPPNGPVDCTDHDASFGASRLGNEEMDVLACLREVREATENFSQCKPSHQSPSRPSTSTTLPQEAAFVSSMDEAPPSRTDAAPLLDEALLLSAASTAMPQEQKTVTQTTQPPVLPLEATQPSLDKTEAQSQGWTVMLEVPVQPAAEQVPQVLAPEHQPEPQQTESAEIPIPSQKRRLRKVEHQQVSEADTASEAGKKLRKKTLPRVAGAKSPVVARFAFEFFRERVENSEPNSDLTLPVLVRKWMQLSDDERKAYKQLAEEDCQRFTAECKQWEEQVAASGKSGPVDVNQILQRRRASLEKKLDNANKTSTRQSAATRQSCKDANGQARTRDRPPPGFPRFPRTAYACFCREQTEKRRPGGSTEAAEEGVDSVFGNSEEQKEASLQGKATALSIEVTSVGVESVTANNLVTAAGATSRTAEGQFAADARKAVGDVARAEPTEKKKSSIDLLKYLRTAWKNLSDEEKAHYTVIAAQDRERFQTEFETWRQQQPDEGWGDGLTRNMLIKIRNTVGWNHRPKLKKPKVPRAQAINLINKCTQDMDMGEILQCAAAVGLQEQYDERRRQAKEAKEATTNQEGSRPSKQPVTGLQGNDDLLGTEGTNGSTPNPQGIPCEMQPNESVDDLLGELAVSNDAQDEEDFAGDLPLDDFDENLNEGALMPHDDFFGPPAIPSWQETPETMGAPKVLGPQLCLDESGNFVLDKSSLTRDVAEEHAPAEGVPIQEAVSQYSHAYKKTPACKWSDEETGMFYEALALYGTDLFLVQTFFRNKSAAQIKSKFSREMKRNGKHVEEVLMRSVKKLTKEPFERMHGKIDTSKHYVPPSSPLPGEEREAEGTGFGEEEDRMPEAEPPPPEPEYSAEDESLTTNRLMALFD